MHVNPEYGRMRKLPDEWYFLPDDPTTYYITADLTCLILSEPVIIVSRARVDAPMAITRSRTVPTGNSKPLTDRLFLGSTNLFRFLFHPMQF
jgi:hypothetical protein